MEELALLAARQVLNRQSVDLHPMMSPGKVNHTYRADGGSDRVVIRLNGEPHRKHEFHKEQWAMEKARSVGVDTPKVLALGRIRDVSYQVQTFIDGRHPAADDVSAWVGIGRALRAVHGVPVQGWGGRFDVESEVFVHCWEEHVERCIGLLGETDPLRAHGLLDGALSTSLETAWRDLPGLPVGLSHGDVSVRNVLLRADGQTVLIDWGCAGAASVPFADVISIAGEHDPSSPEIDAFFKGYGSSWDEMQPRLTAVATLGAVDLCRWAIDQRPDELPRCLHQARWALDFYWEGRPWRPRPDSPA